MKKSPLKLLGVLQRKEKSNGPGFNRLDTYIIVLIIKNDIKTTWDTLTTITFLEALPKYQQLQNKLIQNYLKYITFHSVSINGIEVHTCIAFGQKTLL